MCNLGYVMNANEVCPWILMRSRISDDEKEINIFLSYYKNSSIPAWSVTHLKFTFVLEASLY